MEGVDQKVGFHCFIKSNDAPKLLFCNYIKTQAKNSYNITMLKIDFHIHTIKTDIDSNSDRNFNVNFLKYYVDQLKLDCIAITNHNIFDIKNYTIIKNELANITVFPGMEISINGFHLLVICSQEESKLLYELNNYFKNQHENIDLDSFIKIVDSIESEDFILIPHWMKSKMISDVEIEQLEKYVKCGEVGNRKKFIREIKNRKSKLIPVLFSDFRAFTSEGTGEDEWFNHLTNRFTYVDCTSTELKTIKGAIEQRHVSVSSSILKPNEIEFLIDGSTISTSINVILGARASGKTWLLNQISKTFMPNEINYIKQFSITSDSDEEKFINDLQEKYINLYDWLRSNLLSVITEYENIDIEFEKKKVDENLTKLKDFANSQSDNDIFSRTKWFQETKFSISKNKGNDLIKSLNLLKSNDWHNEIIYKFVSKEKINELYTEIENLWKSEELNLVFKKRINVLVTKIKNDLSKKSSIIAPDDIDFKSLFIHMKTNKLNNELFAKIKNNILIDNIKIDDFAISVYRQPFNSVSEMKRQSGISKSIKDYFEHYKNNNFYLFVKSLLNNQVDKSQIVKAIFDIKVDIKNGSNEPLSGGERALFILLKRISDMNGKEILIIDEPEPAFDNPFIFNKIIPLIEEQAQEGKTICISTHNSSLGMLLNSNKIIFCKSNNGEHSIYFGEHSNSQFKSIKGETIGSYDAIIKIMESGKQPYIKKGEKYENFKNRK